MWEWERAGEWYGERVGSVTLVDISKRVEEGMLPGEMAESECDGDEEVSV